MIHNDSDDFAEAIITMATCWQMRWRRCIEVQASSHPTSSANERTEVVVVFMWHQISDPECIMLRQGYSKITSPTFRVDYGVDYFLLDRLLTGAQWMTGWLCFLQDGALIKEFEAEQWETSDQFVSDGPTFGMERLPMAPLLIFGMPTCAAC